MYPIIFEFGVIKVYSYGLAVATGFILAAFLIKLQAQRQNMPVENILNLALYIAISGVLGARIFYVLQNLQFYSKYPQQMFMLHKGGLSFYGGFILAIIFVAIFLKKKHLPFWGILDLFAPYLALAQAIGRIGCLLNGCCYGKPTDFFFSIYFPGESLLRHPVQIYSSLGLLLIFIVLRVTQEKRWERGQFSGQVFLLYCILYSILRFFMEYLRGDNLRVFVNLTTHQLISILIFIISCIIWNKKWPSYSLRLK